MNRITLIFGSLVTALFCSYPTLASAVCMECYFGEACGEAGGSGWEKCRYVNNVCTVYQPCILTRADGAGECSVPSEVGSAGIPDSGQKLTLDASDASLIQLAQFDHRAAHAAYALRDVEWEATKFKKGEMTLPNLKREQVMRKILAENFPRRKGVDAWASPVALEIHSPSEGIQIVKLAFNGAKEVTLEYRGADSYNTKLVTWR